MMQSRWRLILQILVLYCHDIESLRILGLFPLAGRSHFISNSHLMKGLANRGHQVDVVGHFPLKKPIPNYTDISLAGLAPQYTNNLSYEGAMTFNQYSKRSFVYDVGIKTCDLLSTEVFQQLLKTPKGTYDVVIVQMFVADCYYAFGKYLNAPVVGIVTSRMQDWLHDPLGVPLHTAYMPSLFTTSSQSMTFMERLRNTFWVKILIAQINYYVEKECEHVEKFFGRRLSSMSELYDDISLVLVNSHHSINGIMPMPPGVIEVGGLHVYDDHQELSPDIKKWLDDSKNGCVYFSFGSMVRIETFPLDRIEIFYRMFENIAPVRVLMKIADPTVLPPGLPKNVKTSPWLPQVAVLKHLKTKVFITHGGLVGTQESVAHGVPMVGLPIFADQHSNILTYQNKGVAIALKHQEITVESLTDAVQTVLNDPSYSRNIKTLAKVFNDRPMSALDTAIYWVEYAARHGNILKSPATRLTWWQYNLLDVYGFVAFVVLLAFYIIKHTLQRTLKFIQSLNLKGVMRSVSKIEKVE
nr:UDP-glucosyltransferase 332G1 [Meteorus pulchricornis]